MTFHPLAMVTIFSPPDTHLLQESYDTIYLCNYSDGVIVIPVSSIKSVVLMFPDMNITKDGQIIETENFSLMQHPLIELAQYRPDIFNEDDDNEDTITSTAVQ